MKNNKNIWKFRGDLTEEARRKVGMVQLKALTDGGKKLTQSEAVEQIIQNYKIK